MLLNVVTALDLGRSTETTPSSPPGRRPSRRADLRRARAPGRPPPPPRADRGGACSSCSPPLRRPGRQPAELRQRLRRPAVRVGARARRRRARDRRSSAAPDMVVLVRLGAPRGQRAGAAEDRARRAASCAIADVADVAAYRAGGPRALVSRDGRSTYLLATFRSNADDDDAGRASCRTASSASRASRRAAASSPSPRSPSRCRRTSRAPRCSPSRSCSCSRCSSSAAPSRRCCRWSSAATTILATFLGLRLVNNFDPMSIFALNLITGARARAGDRLLAVHGLALPRGARDGRRRAAPRCRRRCAPPAATVLFSAVTVAAAMAALIVFHLRFLYSMGVGGALVALIAALVSLTLLPALLAALGQRVNALSLKRWQVAIERDAEHVRSGGWYRLSQRVMRRPVPIAIIAATVLIVLGLPFLRIEFTGVDASCCRVRSRRASCRRRDQRRVPAGPTSPIYAVVADRRRRRRAGLCRAARAAAGRRGGAGSRPRRRRLADRRDRQGAAACPTRPSSSCATSARCRPPFPHRVGGGAAAFLDQQASLRGPLPLALALLCSTTLAILFVMTGSVVLPVKALLMNLLTLSAAFGLLVLIFQDGRLEGCSTSTRKARSSPRSRCCCSRSRSGSRPTTACSCSAASRRRATPGMPDREAVATGLERTGRIVTFAALLFCVAIGCVRDIPGRLHQAARRRDGARRADRRVHRARAPRPVADGAARALELVGAASARPTARPSTAG